MNRIHAQQKRTIEIAHSLKVFLVITVFGIFLIEIFIIWTYYILAIFPLGYTLTFPLPHPIPLRALLSGVTSIHSEVMNAPVSLCVADSASECTFPPCGSYIYFYPCFVNVPWALEGLGHYSYEHILIIQVNRFTVTFQYMCALGMGYTLPYSLSSLIILSLPSASFQSP